jgi:hypothetical protein
MKLKLFLLFVISLNFSSFINSSHLPKRKLDSTDNNKLLIIGFEQYTKDFSQNIDEVNFNMHLKKIDNTLELINIYLKSSVEYEDGQTNDNMDVTCELPFTDEQRISYCKIKNFNISNKIANVRINNDIFIIQYNATNNLTLHEDEILLSSLAEETIKNIETQNDSLSYWIFNLNKVPNITKNEGKLYGEIDFDGDPQNFSFNLNLTEPTNCLYNYYNYNPNKSQIITFTPKNNINAHLNGMMSLTSSFNYYILLFANNTDDLVLYSKEQITYVELLGFGNYDDQSPIDNARNQVYFLGTANNLKKYLRFTATITNTNRSSLRALQVPKVVNATGNLTSIDLNTGLAIYNVSYNGTAGMTGNLLIISGNDYKFSNDINNFDSSAVTVIIIGQNINITNPNALIAEFINTMEKPTYSGNSFSFNMRFPNTTQKLNISDKQTMYLDYYNLENSKRDEIDCAIENKTSYFTILCEPKKDVYTQFKTLIMKIPNLSSRRLRFLQTAGNSTYLAPLNANGDIQFEYNPEVNTFARKASKKKGLSGGAIAAIVLATVAAIAAVGIAMFFLNRGPVNPIKTSTEMNLPNSTTNINN